MLRAMRSDSGSFVKQLHTSLTPFSPDPVSALFGILYRQSGRGGSGWSDSVAGKARSRELCDALKLASYGSGNFGDGRPWSFNLWSGWPK